MEVRRADRLAQVQGDGAVSVSTEAAAEGKVTLGTWPMEDDLRPASRAVLLDIEELDGGSCMQIGGKGVWILRGGEQQTTSGLG